MKRIVVLFWVLLSVPVLAAAAGKAQGFIVIRDGTPVFKNAETKDVWFKVDRGEPFVGITTLGLLGRDSVGASGGWIADEKDGRLHVLGIGYRKPTDKFGVTTKLWIAKADVVEFLYECGCGKQGVAADDPSADPCSPLVQAGGLRLGMGWNLCFREGMDQALAELNGPSVNKNSSGQEPATTEQRLKTLEELYQKKLLTKEEYEKKRAEILKDF